MLLRSFIPRRRILPLIVLASLICSVVVLGPASRRVFAQAPSGGRQELRDRVKKWIDATGLVDISRDGYDDDPFLADAPAAGWTATAEKKVGVRDADRPAGIRGSYAYTVDVYSAADEKIAAEGLAILEARVGNEVKKIKPIRDALLIHQTQRIDLGDVIGTLHSFHQYGDHNDFIPDSVEFIKQGHLPWAPIDVFAIWRRGPYVVIVNGYVMGGETVVTADEVDNGTGKVRVPPLTILSRVAALLSAVEKDVIERCKQLDPYFGAADLWRVTATPILNARGKIEFPPRLRVKVHRDKVPGDLKSMRMPVIIQVRGMSLPNGLLPCLELQKHESPSGDTRPTVAALVSGGVTLVPMQDDVYFDDRSFDPAVSGESDIRLLSMTQSGRIAETQAFVLLQLDYSKLGRAIRKSLIDGVVPMMEVRALAAPAFWEGAISPDRPLQLSDFSITSPWVRIEVDRIADIVKLGKERFGEYISSPQAMRANTPSTGFQAVTPPYPLYPGDKLSFGPKDAAMLHWVAGEKFSFTANPSALTPKEDRLICVISATQAEDILDLANYPGDRWGQKAQQLLGIIKSKHPAVSLVFKAGKGTLWSLVFKKYILAQGVSMTVDHRVITGIVDEAVDLFVPKPPVIIQLESTAVFQLKSQPEFYLLEGKLTLLDSELKPRTTITSGQALKFDERNQPLPPQSFQRSDLPAEAQEALRIVESMVEAKPIDWFDPSTLGLYVGYVIAGLFGLYVLKKSMSWLFGSGKRRASLATTALRSSPMLSERKPEAATSAKKDGGFSPIGLLILLGFAGGLGYGAYFTLEDVTRNWKVWPKGEELAYVGMMGLVGLFFLGWAVKHVYSSARQ